MYLGKSTELITTLDWGCILKEQTKKLEMKQDLHPFKPGSQLPSYAIHLCGKS